MKKKYVIQEVAGHTNSQVWKKTVTHTAIIKKAKAKKWTRNLANQVKERIKEQLVTKVVTEAVTDCNQSLSEQTIIEEAADVESKVVIRYTAPPK